MLHGLKRARRRNFEFMDATSADAFDPMGVPVTVEQFPNVPALDLSDRPGTTLKYQLPFSITPGCMLIGVLGVCLFWNGITWTFVGLAIANKFQGMPQWVLRLFLTPFV